MTYHRVCNKSNTTGATYGAGNADTSRAHEFAPVFSNGLSRVRVVRVFKLHVFTFLGPCCDVHYDFRIKTMFDSS
jgi:hypothetical protein